MLEAFSLKSKMGRWWLLLTLASILYLRCWPLQQDKRKQQMERNNKPSLLTDDMNAYVENPRIETEIGTFQGK
jgi:hypothetical protein